MVGKILLRADWLSHSASALKWFRSRSRNIFKALSACSLPFSSALNNWLLEAFSQPFKDHKVDELSQAFQRVTHNWRTQPLICCLGPSGSTRELIRAALFSEDRSVSQPNSLSYLSRRQELEKKERPFALVSIRCMMLNHINGSLRPEGYLGIYSLEVCRVYTSSWLWILYKWSIF